MRTTLFTMLAFFEHHHFCRLFSSRPPPPIAPFPTTCRVRQGPSDPDPDPEHDHNDGNVVSRRVFLAATLTPLAFTAATSLSIFPDTPLAIALRDLSLRFTASKSVAPPSPAPSPDPAFTRAVLDAALTEALRLGLAKSTSQLAQEQSSLAQRAAPLFFPQALLPSGSEIFALLSTNRSNAQPLSPLLSQPIFLNFALYVRLRCIALASSPASRTALSAGVAVRTLPLLVDVPKMARSPRSTTSWLEGVHALLQALVRRGWLSSFSVQSDDVENGTWAEEGRAALTVFAQGVVSMQAAQLLAEDSLEEIAPKVSPWLVAYLASCGIHTSCEDYYMDDVYRPDTWQYTPTVMASQLDLTVA